MATYAALLTLARDIEDQIHGDLPAQDLKPLSEAVVKLQAILDNFPQATLSQDFEARIRDYAYRAANTIEIHFSDLHRRDEGGCFSILTSFFNCILPWMNLRWLHRRLHKLADEAASLVLEAQNLQGAVVTNDPIMELRESSSSIYTRGGATQKVRLYSDITELEDRLYEGSPHREVIPIVGMGGSGKTTLANFLFNDSRTQRRFDRRAWITVSQNYDKLTLLSQILRDLKESQPENPEDVRYEELGVKVFMVLKNRRYMIVIDDVWSEKLWDDINIYLPDDDIGSRILLTTRDDNVAYYAAWSSESYIHRLELMDLDSSWSLLKNIVFGDDEDCPSELEEIGKSIAKDCSGLPLAIVVIAGVLSSANNREDIWEKIVADVRTVINISSSNRVAKILSLSYINLPHHLKPCFLYMACFPKDREIKVSKLIMMWVAEGFLKLNKSERYDEEVAYECLNDLVKKNLVVVSKIDYNRRIKRCRLDNIIRQMCVDIAWKENFWYEINDYRELFSEEIKDHIRLGICADKNAFDVRQIPTSRIRSLIYIQKDYRSAGDIGGVLHMTSFRLLRVLDATYAIFKDFPHQLCQLFHLRYLSFTIGNRSGTSSVYGQLATIVKELRNLQVLRFEVENDLAFEFPLEFWQMSKLRHIILRYAELRIGTRLSSPTSGCQNLQTLCGVVDLKLTEEVLQMIPNLKKLELLYINRENSVSDDYMFQLDNYSLKNLLHLSKLENLKFICKIPGVWKTFQLPPGLKKLSLFYCRFPWTEFGAIVGSLPNLEALKLKHNACDGDVWEVKEGEFPNLKMLEIDNTSLVVWKYDGKGSHIFPSLEHLCLFRFKSLREVPRGIGDIDTLRRIEVDRSNKLLVEWASEVMEEQESYGNEDLRVRIGETDLSRSRFASTWGLYY